MMFRIKAAFLSEHVTSLEEARKTKVPRGPALTVADFIEATTTEFQGSYVTDDRRGSRLSLGKYGIWGLLCRQATKSE